jgi:hypothetical protein
MTSRYPIIPALHLHELSQTKPWYVSNIILFYFREFIIDQLCGFMRTL